MADALASGASVRKDVGVRVPPRAPLIGYGKAIASGSCSYQPVGPILLLKAK